MNDTEILSRPNLIITKKNNQMITQTKKLKRGNKKKREQEKHPQYYKYISNLKVKYWVFCQHKSKPTLYGMLFSLISQTGKKYQKDILEARGRQQEI